MLKKSLLLITALFSLNSHAELIGHWTFDNAADLQDKTGNFSDIQLFGDATIENGYLELDGYGDWARSAISTPMNIVDKTLVSWVMLDDLGERSGSALTLDAINNDNFDGIVYGERSPYNQWINGSSNWSRTSTFDIETAAQNTLQELVITYNDLDDVAGGSMEISGFLDGVSIGSYTTNNGSSWSGLNIEALFGTRHTSGLSPISGLDAKIFEARIYDTALTTTEVAALEITEVPEPSALAIFAIGLLGLRRQFRK